jgi:hypothetical protein
VKGIEVPIFFNTAFYYWIKKKRELSLASSSPWGMRIRPKKRMNLEIVRFWKYS